MGPVERIPLIVIHELTHAQAKPVASAKVPSILARCVGEGAPDFITEDEPADLGYWTGAEK
jgi:hypothetical protein